jgi:hypothetical protein
VTAELIVATGYDVGWGVTPGRIIDVTFTTVSTPSTSQRDLVAIVTETSFASVQTNVVRNITVFNFKTQALLVMNACSRHRMKTNAPHTNLVQHCAL